MFGLPAIARARRNGRKPRHFRDIERRAKLRFQEHRAPLPFHEVSGKLSHFSRLAPRTPRPPGAISAEASFAAAGDACRLGSNSGLPISLT